MIVWLNGPFGVGKTTTARALLDLLPDSTLFDPDVVGDALRTLLPRKRLDEVRELADLPAWRRLVVDAGAAVLDEVPGTLVVPLTLVRQDYRDEIFGGFAAQRIPVRHLLLDADETILRRRAADQRYPRAGGAKASGTGDQAHGQPSPRRARPDWLRGDAHLVDTSDLTPRQAAERVADVLRGDAGACDIVQTPRPTAETLAAGVLLFDDRGRVLLVDPTYKPGWEFPGGVVESGEPPASAGTREVAEELGIRLQDPLRLLVVDWEPPRATSYGGLRMLFDGGRLTEWQSRHLLLPPAELRDWRFVTEEQATRLLSPGRLARLRWALRARRTGRPLNLEAGRPVSASSTPS